MDSRESSGFTVSLTGRVAQDADSPAIANVIGVLWAAIEAALQPVIGRRGVAALFKRTVHLTALRHPWLAAAQAGGGDDAAADLVQLTAMFAAQTPSVALEAGDELFEKFRGLLVSLIGARLSERLLQPPLSTPSKP